MGSDILKYVCVLSTDNYLLGVLLLNENLKKVNSKYGLLCLINEKIKSETKNILDYFGIEYRILSNISFDNINEQNPYWIYTFDKLNIFALTEFEKIVYLDSDLLLLQNIDNLFNYNSLSLAPDYPFHPDKYNSGVMVVIPNMDDYTNLVNLARNYNAEGKKISDQDVINDYFFGRITSLLNQYNCMREIINDNFVSRFNYLKKDYDVKLLLLNFSKEIENPFIVHYIGKVKPFMISNEFADKYYHLYMYYLNNIMNQLNTYDVLKSDNLISVIVPIFNKQDYLDKCLQSIINQTYKNLEIILIDDCSTDNSLDICKKYQQNDKRIIIIENETNRGVSYSRNIGIKNSHGNYISFVDADDSIEIKMYEILLKNAINYNLDICQCSTIVNGVREYEEYNDLYLQSDKGNIYIDYMTRMISYVCWDKLYKKNIMIMFDENLNVNEDFKFIFQILNNTTSVGYINDYLYHYTYSKNDSLTGIYKYQDDLQMISILTDIYDIISNEYPSLKQYSNNFLFVHCSECIIRLHEYFMNNNEQLDNNTIGQLNVVKSIFLMLNEYNSDYQEDYIKKINLIDEILSKY